MLAALVGLVLLLERPGPVRARRRHHHAAASPPPPRRGHLASLPAPRGLRGSTWAPGGTGPGPGPRPSPGKGTSGKETRERNPGGEGRAVGLMAVAPLGNERREAEAFVQRFIGWFFVQVFTPRGGRGSAALREGTGGMEQLGKGPAEPLASRPGARTGRQSLLEWKHSCRSPVCYRGDLGLANDYPGRNVRSCLSPDGTSPQSPAEPAPGSLHPFGVEQRG